MTAPCSAHRVRIVCCALVAVLLGGCDADGNPLAPPAPPWAGDDDAQRWTCAGDPGTPRAELIYDDERHEPVPDGGEYEIARRIQGDTTIFAPVWFGGLEGGQFVEEFEMSFITPDGEEIGSRSNGDFLLPCEEDGSVAAHWLEVFFVRFGPLDEFYGVEGTLQVAFRLPDGGPLILDEVDATLVPVAE